MVCKHFACRAKAAPKTRIKNFSLRRLRALRATFPQHHRLDFPAARGQHRGMADANSRRIEKVETNLAHLEHQVEQLNSVVIEQVKLLERLKKEVQRQVRAMESLELERIRSNNPKPPHYQ